MTNSDKRNIFFFFFFFFFFANGQLHNSVNKALNTKGNIAQTSKETNWWSFDESFVGF